MKQNVVELFHFSAPSYDPTAMLDHFFLKFPNVESQKLYLMIAEFVKFIFLQSKYNFHFIPVNGEIDEIWHAFILQTKDYQLFCSALPTAKFIHHASIHLDEFAHDKNRKAVAQELLSWLVCYYKHFGIFTAEVAQYWLMVGFLQKKFNFTLKQINQLAADEIMKTSGAKIK